MVKIEFTKDFAGHKKGAKMELQSLLASKLMREGVAKLDKGKSTPKKSNPKK